MVVQSNLVNVSDTSTSVAHGVGLYLYLLLNWINESLRLVGSWPTPAVPTLHYTTHTERERELVDVWTTSKAVASTPGTVSNSSWYPNTISAAKMKMKITKTKPQPPQKKQNKKTPASAFYVCFSFLVLIFWGFFFITKKKNTQLEVKKERERERYVTTEWHEMTMRIPIGLYQTLSLSFLFLLTTSHTHPSPGSNYRSQAAGTAKQMLSFWGAKTTGINEQAALEKIYGAKREMTGQMAVVTTNGRFRNDRNWNESHTHKKCQPKKTFCPSLSLSHTRTHAKRIMSLADVTQINLNFGAIFDLLVKFSGEKKTWDSQQLTNWQADWW